MGAEKYKDLTIEYLHIGELNPYENNPRRNEQAIDPVAESLKKYGWRWPILIDKNNVIIAGHTRYMAAKKLGLTRIPCSRADDLPDELVREFRLVGNKTGELAGWDFDLLNDELKAIGESLEEFGFDADLGELNLNDFFETPSTPRDKNQSAGTHEDADGDEAESDETSVVCPHCGKSFKL